MFRVAEEVRLRHEVNQCEVLTIVFAHKTLDVLAIDRDLSGLGIDQQVVLVRTLIRNDQVAHSACSLTEGAQFDSSKFLLQRVLSLIVDHLLLHYGKLVDQLLALCLFLHHCAVQLFNHLLEAANLQYFLGQFLSYIKDIIIELLFGLLNFGLFLIQLFFALQCII